MYVFFSAFLAGTVFRTVPRATVAPKELLTRFATKIMGSAFVKKDSVARGATSVYLGGTDSPTAYSASAWSQV